MKYSKILLFIMMILPWFSIPLIGRRTFNRFFPAGLFMALLVIVTNVIAKKRRWWWWYETLQSQFSGSIPFIFGPFLIGSLWIMKWTYGKLIKFISLNIIVDGVFTYLVVPFLTKFGIASLVRMTKLQLMYVFAIPVSLLYIFQSIIESIQHNFISRQKMEVN